MSKAGKGDSVDTGSVGSQHPVPENIPHLSSPNGQNGSGTVGHQHHPSLHGHSHGSQQVTSSGSPVKESSFLHRETSVDDGTNDTAAKAAEQENKATSPTSENSEAKSIPIRG